jgi:hypothetical protein
MINIITTDLDNYINYIKNTNKKRKFDNNDLQCELINEAVEIIMNDVQNLYSPDINDIISNKCDEYKDNKQLIKDDKNMSKERKLYNLALYSLMIKIIDDFITIEMEDNFNDYLLNLQDSLYSDVPMKKSKLIPIATFPLTTFLNMLSTLNKNTTLDEDVDGQHSITFPPPLLA